LSATGTSTSTTRLDVADGAWVRVAWSIRGIRLEVTGIRLAPLGQVSER
jgi:hypothetical protein